MFDQGMVVSDGPSAKKSRRLRLRARGERLEPDATTDVWALDNFAYTGTFNSPCGGEEGAGVWVWRVKGNSADLTGVIESPVGSRSNDVKVADMNSGRILVHSNESCNNGPGGFEIYDVDDPRDPVFLTSVVIDELNEITPTFFTPGALEDVGVHNLWLFTQDDQDFVSVVSEGVFDNFRIYDITNPSAPELVGAWGAEEVFDPGVGDLTPTDDPDGSRTLNAVLWLLSGFGNSQNRFLHDITGTADGNFMYLSNWDAGLILLDISDPTDPTVVSVALEVDNGSLDGEVNSHAAWPSEDGKIVVETEEDFNANVSTAPPGNLTFGDNPTNTIPGTAIATTAGDVFESSQTGNNVEVTAFSVTVTSGPLVGEVFPAIELSGNQPKFGDVGAQTGEAVWIGQACNPDPTLNADAFDTGDLAVVRRGACTFAEKLANAAALGASAIVISNNQTDDTPWGGVRIWDYSDPANPVLASTFNTVCSADSVDPSCDPLGTFTVHNILVETKGKQVRAYLSWYWEGVLILDVTDPYNPVEIARFSDNSAEFREQNGGPQDVWGIFKERRGNRIFASDRNGGLYVLKESGGLKVAEK